MKPIHLVALLFFFVPSSAAAQQGPAAQTIAYDYGALYESLNPSIVKVFADGGHGSGFLVSADGLIATNHHVVRNSRHLSVQFADGRKVAAHVVTLDPRFDVAVLKINRAAVGGVKPLQLLPAERDGEVKAGTPVLAFGSPLSQTFLMTQGIVAKVEEGVLLGDFLIQSGNSGGPLVTLKGEVIGINTFAEKSISGAVRVTALRNILASPVVTGYNATEPAATPLPIVPSQRYPTEALKEKIASEPFDPKVYRLDARKFSVTAMTPVLVGKTVVQEDLIQARNRMTRRGKKITDPTWREADTPFYEWMRSAESALDDVVTFEVKPDFGTTTGSKWASALTAIAAGVSKTPMSPVHQTMEFKAEFQDFKLYRDNELITPVHPGRAITEASFEADYFTFIDEAYSGMYSYLPDVFLTGNSYRVEIFDAREPGRAHAIIPLPSSHALIQQLRRDFVHFRQKGSTLPVAVQPTAPTCSGLTQWTSNLSGLSAELDCRGPALSITFVGSGEFTGAQATLVRGPSGLSGTYQSKLCGTVGQVDLRETEQGWQGAIERVECVGGTVSRVRVGFLLKPVM
jgi:hypothetical protein